MNSLKATIAVVAICAGLTSSKLAFAQQFQSTALGTISLLPENEANTLFADGRTALSERRFTEALSIFEQALSLYQSQENISRTEKTLESIGTTYMGLGDTAQAVDYYQQALIIQRDLDDSVRTGTTLYALCAAYKSRSNFSAALESCQQSAALLKDSDEDLRELYVLELTSSLYIELGEYELARERLREALASAIEIEARSSEGRILSNIGLTFQNQGQFSQAISFLEKAIAIQTALEESHEEARTLNKLGEVYTALQDYDQAVDVLSKALSLSLQFEDELRYQGAILDSLGTAYRGQGAYVEALSVYQQALIINRRLGNRDDESFTLKNIGGLFLAQDKIAIATIFYKRSVNISESIRSNIENLEQETQDAYTQTVANTYRQLADLLLQQGRFLEAQQVLELLKIEEIREFTRATYTTEGIQYDSIEQAVIDTHGSLIALGIELTQCDSDCDELYEQNRQLKRRYDESVETFDATVRENRADDDVFYDPADLLTDAAGIVADLGTMLIYPIVLEDSIWLLWTTDRVVDSVEVKTTNRLELSRAALRFRELLSQRDAESFAELKRTGQQLHEWLIKPLQEELQKNNIQKLVFAQDRETRYLPMGALYDGEQFLIENYTVSTVLSAALTDTEDRLGAVDATQALGLGLSQAIPTYEALPNVAEELDALVRSDEVDTRGVYPGEVLIDDAFTLASLSRNVQDYRILHIASHAEFVPREKGESYILSGTGERITVADLSALAGQLRGLHLVVLSACETAVGGESWDGTEIAGLSSYFLGPNKAVAVLASLWQVDDAGTSLLMQRFYQLLATGLPKAEAMRQAQLSLLYGEETLEARERGSVVLVDEKTTPLAGTAHPYYWAPFVLIGNGL